jgi:hypothetical protein
MQESIAETPFVSRQAHDTEHPQRDGCQRLNHTQWECLYQVVFLPKRRRRMLSVALRKYLGEVFRR